MPTCLRETLYIDRVQQGREACPILVLGANKIRHKPSSLSSRTKSSGIREEYFCNTKLPFVMVYPFSYWLTTSSNLTTDSIVFKYMYLRQCGVRGLLANLRGPNLSPFADICIKINRRITQCGNRLTLRARL